MKESRVFSKGWPSTLHVSSILLLSRSLILSPIRDGCLACRLVRRKAPTVEAPGERAAASSLLRSLTLVRRRSPLSFPPSLARVSREEETGGGGGLEEDENHVHELLHMHWTLSDNFTQRCEKVCAATRTVAWLDVGKRRSHRYSRG